MPNTKISSDPVATATTDLYVAGIQAGSNVRVPASLLVNVPPKVTSYTVAGSYTHTFETSALWAEVILVAGGGGGGGAEATTSGEGSAGCGGASGAVAKKVITALQASASLSVGAKGVGQLGIAGTAGGNTTYSDGVVSVSALGGTAGSLVGDTTALIMGSHIAGPTATGADFVLHGQHGEGPLLLPSGGRVRSGTGGSTPFGRGARGTFGPSSGINNGTNALGPGGGGSGGTSQGVGADATGGDGYDGLIIIIEHFSAYVSANIYDLSAPGGSGSGSSGLSGKVGVFFGDSLTENGDYPARVAARLGLASGLRIGFGGCRMGRHTGISVSAYYDPMCMYKLVDYIASDDYTDLIAAADALYAHNADDNRATAASLATINWSAVDFVVIAFGTNDFTGEVPLGTATDADGTTFRGAVNYVIETFLGAYPEIQMVFVAPLWRQVGGEDADTEPNDNGDFLIEYVDALKEQAERYQIPVLDLYRTGGVNRINWESYIPDGTHPLAGFGYQHLADKVASFLSATL